MANLAQYLSHYPLLQALYFAKQRLTALLLVKNIRAKHAKRLLPKLLALINQFAQSPAKTLAHNLMSWLNPIIRMWRFSKSNCNTDCFHNKIEKV